jgi:serine/threonine protein kinase
MKHGKKEVDDICGYSSEFRKSKDWRFFVHAAKNLAQAVVGVHVKNQVIGDLNDKNILVSPDNVEVTLIDTDSFHIAVGSKTHRCTVGMSEFIAPEIHGINFRSAALPTFTEHTDNFSLAILIFKLLMNGLHPFYNSDGSSIEENMRHGVSPCFIKSKKGMPFEVPYAPPIDILPQNLQGLFKRAFVDGATAPKKRPSAREFYNELEKLADDSNMQGCPYIAWHKFPIWVNECPWCAVTAKMGALMSGGSPASPGVSRSVSVHGNYEAAPAMSFTGSRLPAPIKDSMKITAIVACIVIMLVTIGIIIAGFYMLNPWIFIISAVITGIIALIRLPKFDYANSFDTSPNVPSYFSASYKKDNKIRFVLIPRWCLWIFNTLCLAMVSLCTSLIVMGAFVFFTNLWMFVGITLLGLFGALYLFEKRTLWTKTALGITMGVITILAMLANLGLLLNVLI